MLFYDINHGISDPWGSSYIGVEVSFTLGKRRGLWLQHGPEGGPHT